MLLQPFFFICDSACLFHAYRYFKKNRHLQKLKGPPVCIKFNIGKS